MNVFDWPGPDFLGFYAIFAAGVLLLQAALGASGMRNGRTPDLSDPYLIAFLRGDALETLHVATLALIDRGLLQVDGDRVVTAAGVDLRSVKLPVEQALLTWFAEPRPTSSLRHATIPKGACERYATTLTGLDLRTSSTIASRRNVLFAVALALLLGVAGTKLALALARGRTNVIFLVGMAWLAALLSKAIWSRSKDVRARALLASLRKLLTGLPVRAKSLPPGGATAELALLAAVFGLNMVPLSFFPARDAAFGEVLARAKRDHHSAVRAEARADRGGWFTGCGSSCGSSGGSSCGSSCGGGGCGGGCGGCSS